MNDTSEDALRVFALDWQAVQMADHQFAWAIMAALLRGAQMILSTGQGARELIDDLGFLEEVADIHRQVLAERAWNNRTGE